MPPAAIDGAGNWSLAEQDGERFTFSVRSNQTLPLLLRHLVASGADVYEFTPRRVSLEEKFVSLMGEDRGL